MHSDIKVKDAMITRVITATPNHTVFEASKIMKKEDVGSIVIVEGSKPVGIVTREDIVDKVTAKDLKSSSVSIKNIMSKKLVTCSPDNSITEVAKLMSKYRYERIPVVSMGKLVGIISAREIARVAPALLEITTEHLRMEEPSLIVEETTSGECELCGNYAEELYFVDDKWICESCRDEGEVI